MKRKDFRRLFLEAIRTAIDALKLPDGECLRERLLWLELQWVAEIFWDQIYEASEIINRNLRFKSKHFSLKSTSSILKNTSLKGKNIVAQDMLEVCIKVSQAPEASSVFIAVGQPIKTFKL